MIIYIAGPLFTLAEQLFNESFTGRLRNSLPEAEIILPQERAKVLLGKPNALRLIFDDCIEMVRKCDVVVAVLDGPDADSGTCVELGYAFAEKKPIVGIRTDFRASEDRGLNLMVSHVCTTLIYEESGEIEPVVTKVCSALRSLHL